MFDLTIIGNFCLDYFKGREKYPDYIRLGSTAVYASKTAQKLGKKVALISSVGPEFKSDYIKPLIDAGIDIHLIRTQKSSTAFIHEYVKNERVLTLKSRGKIINKDDIPDEYLNSQYYHIGAIANEVHPNVLEKLSSYDIPIGLDLHGFVRKFDKKGGVTLGSWDDAEKYLKHVTFLKGTDKEAQALTGAKNIQNMILAIAEMGPKVIILTLAHKGSMVYADRIFLQIPTIVYNIVDETGAGDTYFMAFVIDYLEKKDLYHAALFGASAASFKMEEVGPFGFATPEQIEERIQEFLSSK